MNTWLSAIVDDNAMDLDTLISEIVSVLSLTDSKISTLVLIGQTLASLF